MTGDRGGWEWLWEGWGGVEEVGKIVEGEEETRVWGREEARTLGQRESEASANSCTAEEEIKEAMPCILNRGHLRPRLTEHFFTFLFAKPCIRLASAM